VLSIVLSPRSTCSFINNFYHILCLSHFQISCFAAKCSRLTMQWVNYISLCTTSICVAFLFLFHPSTSWGRHSVHLPLCMPLLWMKMTSRCGRFHCIILENLGASKHKGRSCCSLHGAAVNPSSNHFLTYCLTNSHLQFLVHLGTVNISAHTLFANCCKFEYWYLLYVCESFLKLLKSWNSFLKAEIILC